jgi:hypothetical protein
MQRGEEKYLILILDRGTWWGWVVSVSSRPRFTPWEMTTGAQCIWSWVGFRAGLDAEARGEILCFCPCSNSSPPACSQTLPWLSYPSSNVFAGRLWNFLLSFFCCFRSVWLSFSECVTPCEAVAVVTLYPSRFAEGEGGRRNLNYFVLIGLIQQLL